MGPNEQQQSIEQQITALPYKSKRGAYWALEVCKELAGPNPIHCESRLYFSIPGIGIPDDLQPVFGHVDAWFYDIHGDLHIVDLKQGSPKKDHFYQMCGYAYALMDKFFEAKCHLHVLYFTMERRITRQDVSFDEARANVVHCIKNKLDENAVRTPNEFCKYCAHFMTCDAVRDRVAEGVYLDMFLPGGVSEFEAEDLHWLASLKENLKEKVTDVVREKYEAGDESARVKGVNVISVSRKGKPKKAECLRELLAIGATASQIIESMDFKSRDEFEALYKSISRGGSPPESCFETPTESKQVRRVKGYKPIRDYDTENNNQ